MGLMLCSSMATEEERGRDKAVVAGKKRQMSERDRASSGSLSLGERMAASEGEEEGSKSALSEFRAKEEEIERLKMEVRERVQAQLGRVEEEAKRLVVLRKELEALTDPLRKEVTCVGKKIDSISRELKPLGQTVQKKEKEYREALEAFNDKNKEKVQLINKLVELVGESEAIRMKKLEELSKSIDF